ncbi:MAG: ATP-binding cassette domain-containing protein, partial [Mesorhizobium sp.]
GELSGGERQRVALARVLVRDRPVLLLDEPFASLGPALRDDMLDLVAGVHAERRMTVLFVTHQPEDAHRIGQDMVFLDNGAVAATGAVADFFTKAGPEAFRRYIGAGPFGQGSRDVARKRT